MAIQEEMVECVPRLRRYARALIGDHELADDLVQDTLERGLRYASSFRAGTNLLAWLMTIMHNVFLNEANRPARRASHVALDDDGLGEEEFAVSDDPVGYLEVRDLDAALQRLPVEQREVVLMVGLEEMSYAEVALTLDIPIGTVMSRLSRGRERLRALTARVRVAVRLSAAGKL